MKYINSECCITPDEVASASNSCPINWNKNNGWCPNDKKCDNDGDNWYQDSDCGCENENIKRRLTELQFAAIDLNEFLDTHPNCTEALAMFKKVTKTIESVKMDYVKKYGPLKACDSSADAPFQWASAEYKWPWEK